MDVVSLPSFREAAVPIATQAPAEGMLNPAIYPHPCTAVQVVETHISRVYLTGLRAYKLKKPVKLEFADFSTLQRRRRCCEEELRINQRLAPHLYLDVVPITGTSHHSMIGGDGTPIDYAVRMVQFNQSRLLSAMPPGALQPSHIDNLADRCARFHRDAAVAPPQSRFGALPSIRSAIEANFEALIRTRGEAGERLATLQAAADLQLRNLKAVIAQRRDEGMIRECHGDLHLGNMFLESDQVTVFDGIEFNDDLRWIDIISDIAFVVMDLEDRGYHELSNRLLNRWLERTGDYSGLAVLQMYCSYRAMVRAKIDAIRMHQHDLSADQQQQIAEDCLGYLDMAERFSRPRARRLTITCGPSGSGKTTASQRLVEDSGAIRIRSDVERKRMFGLAPEQHSSTSMKREMYAPHSSLAVYRQLEQLAAGVLEVGFPVVVDAAFLRRAERHPFRRLADRLSVPFEILECRADRDELIERIAARRNDASEADKDVLARQLQEQEPLSEEERQVTVQA